MRVKADKPKTNQIDANHTKNRFSTKQLLSEDLWAHQSVGYAGDQDHGEISNKSVDEEDEKQGQYHRDSSPEIQDSGGMSEAQFPDIG